VIEVEEKMEDESMPLVNPDNSNIIDANFSNSNIKEGGSNQFASHYD
jgi:hypothetical protein|tara:strand:- start:828 stop:968 length:141 start_codon:yes stop_codon:yes gene_type:complete